MSKCANRKKCAEEQKDKSKNKSKTKRKSKRAWARSNIKIKNRRSGTVKNKWTWEKKEQDGTGIRERANEQDSNWAKSKRAHREKGIPKAK